MQKLSGKRLLVTGAGRGIGKVIAARLASEGASVCAHAPEPQPMDYPATFGDLSDPAVPARLIAEAVTTLGGLDGLVNNAALTTRSNLQTTDVALFDRLIAVNLRAPLLLIQAALPHFKTAGVGRVVTIGSSNAHCGERNLLAYAISKGGLIPMTRNLADTHGVDGLRINQINLGWTLSDTEYALKRAEGMPENWHENLPAGVAPSGGLIQPEEVAAFVAFLLSDEAGRLNGSVMDYEQYPLIGRNPPKN
jgi:NAD(P)-dependent dehydrogenase (short-subunit alcohol dehydrogenase family)